MYLIEASIGNVFKYEFATDHSSANEIYEGYIDDIYEYTYDVQVYNPEDYWVVMSELCDDWLHDMLNAKYREEIEDGIVKYLDLARLYEE